MNKNVVVVHFRKVKTLKISFVITLSIIQRKISVYLFSTAHYKLVIVLHKDALFHFLELLLSQLLLQGAKCSQGILNEGEGSVRLASWS